MMALVVDGDRRRRQVLGELLAGADVADVGATNVALEYLVKRTYQLAVIGDPDDAVDGLPLAVEVEARGLRVPVVLVANGDAARLRARGRGCTSVMDVISYDRAADRLPDILSRLPDWRPGAQHRRGRPRRTWLTDGRGRPYRLTPSREPAVGFQVMYQESEGRLWRRLTDGQGWPLLMPLTATRLEFERQVGRRPGTYQLLPVSNAGVLSGNPPEMIVLGEARRTDQRDAP